MKLINNLVLIFRRLPLITRLFVSLSFVCLIFLAYIVINSSINPNSSTKPIAFQKDIYPGKSSKEDVINKLGQPQKTTTWQDQTILNYPTQSKWNNQVFTNGDSVELITEQVAANSTLKKTDYLKELGQPESILYGPLSPARDLYLYPSRGFGFVGSKFNESIFQLWYFKPTSLDNFLTTIASKQNYSVTPPVEEE